MRIELERVDLIRYVKCILTAYVVKSPPDHEAGLSLLLRLRGRIHQLSIFSSSCCITDLGLSIGTDPTVVEDAVKYIIFLVDADRLFDTALGMYDFNLVLMIAQHAQKVGSLFDHTSGTLTDSHRYLCCVSASLS